MAMVSCKICGRAYAARDLSNIGVCSTCERSEGLPPRTEPLRPRIPCARCQHTSFVRCHVIRERAASASPTGSYSTEYIAPLSATFATSPRKTFWAGRDEERADPHRPVGVFEVYVCRTCGFVEWYARDAAQIPIGEEHGTELFDVDSGTPYR
jgi:hypothetical protein